MTHVCLSHDSPGHAGAIISGGQGRAELKIQKLEEAGVLVTKSPAKMGEEISKVGGHYGMEQVHGDQLKSCRIKLKSQL